MAIKRLMRSTEIADSPFRSLQDVEKLLKNISASAADEDQILRQMEGQFKRSLQKAAEIEFIINREKPGAKPSPTINALKFDKIVVPKLDALQQNFTIVDELTEKVDLLNTLHSQVSVSFRGVRGCNEMLSSILATKKGIQAKLDRALEFLKGIGDKYAPQHFKDMVNEICTAISEELTFSNYHIYGYATAHEGDLTFTTYVQLQNLQEEDGDQYVEFYVVFTCVLQLDPEEKTKMNASYFITVMHHFETPGKFNPGRPFTNVKTAMSSLGGLLAFENISNSIGTLPHNLDPGKMTKDRFQGSDNVAEIKVDADALTFVFLKNTNEAEFKSAGNRLYSQVQQLMQHQMGKKAQVKVKAGRDPKDRRYTLRFTLNAPAQHNQLDTHSLDFLKTQFGLDDSKLRKVVNIING